MSYINKRRERMEVDLIDGEYYIVSISKTGIRRKISASYGHNIFPAKSVLRRRAARFGWSVLEPDEVQ